MSDCLQPCGQYSLWNSAGQNTGVGSCSLLQGIFPTQGLNPGLLHCRRILYQLIYQGSSDSPISPHNQRLHYQALLSWISFSLLALTHSTSSLTGHLAAPQTHCDVRTSGPLHMSCPLPGMFLLASSVFFSPFRRQSKFHIYPHIHP